MIVRVLFAGCVAASLYSTQLQAQRIPVGVLPTRYNGGFAGEAGVLRVASFSFIEYGDFPYPPPGLTSKRIESGTFISVDHFAKKLRSGIAFNLGQHGVADHYRNTSTSLVISPKFSFRGKYTFAPFADFSFENLSHTKVGDYNFFNMKTGFLLNSQKAYAGISAEVLRYSGGATRPQFLSNVRYFFQAGYSFQFKPDSRFSVTPQFLVCYRRYTLTDMQTLDSDKFGDIILMDLNLVFRYKKLLAGINYTGIMLGYQNSRFKLQVTNFYCAEGRIAWADPISGHTYFLQRPYTIGSRTYNGNISLRYIFGKNPSVKTSGF